MQSFTSWCQQLLRKYSYKLIAHCQLWLSSWIRHEFRHSQVFFISLLDGVLQVRFITHNFLQFFLKTELLVFLCFIYGLGTKGYQFEANSLSWFDGSCIEWSCCLFDSHMNVLNGIFRLSGRDLFLQPGKSFMFRFTKMEWKMERSARLMFRHWSFFFTFSLWMIQGFCQLYLILRFMKLCCGIFIREFIMQVHLFK